MGASYPGWLSNKPSGDHLEVPVAKEAFEPSTQNSVLDLKGESSLFNLTKSDVWWISLEATTIVTHENVLLVVVVS